MDAKQEIVAKHLNLKTDIVTIQFSIILAVFFYFEISEFLRVMLGTYVFDGNTFNKMLPHFLDSFTNAFSIDGQILMLLCFREQWIFWIIVNVLQIAMFSGVAHNRFRY